MTQISDFADADVVLDCSDLDGAMQFYIDELGFRLAAIFPADAPRIALLSRYGLSVRLQCSRRGSAPHNAETDPLLRVNHELDQSRWGVGRAGMLYRDLVPGRQGGRLIASHIRIPNGGPVPDYVHYHNVRFQIIYCYRGWVRVVYEDQGPAFVMNAGDCVLQPPKIRHRVLECSDAFEAVEVSSPAEHETRVDHALELPNARIDDTRRFGAQRFVFHQATHAKWQDWHGDSCECRDTGIAAASGGTGAVTVLRRIATGTVQFAADESTRFLFVLAGSARIVGRDDESPLAAGGALTADESQPFALADASADLELLLVSLRH